MALGILLVALVAIGLAAVLARGRKPRGIGAFRSSDASGPLHLMHADDDAPQGKDDDGPNHDRGGETRDA